MKTISIVLLISVVLSVVPCQAQNAWPYGVRPQPGRERGDITIRDQKGNLTIGDYNERTGDLFLFNTKSGKITTGTRDSRGDWDFQEYKGLGIGREDD